MIVWLSGDVAFDQNVSETFRAKSSWSLDFTVLCQGRCQSLGILEERTSDLELDRNWLKLLKVGRRVWSPKHDVP